MTLAFVALVVGLVLGTLIGFTVAGALFAGRLEERESDAR